MVDDPREAYVARIEAVRDRWRRLVAEVGEERMELPGAMGGWTFKDLALHLTAWRRRTIDRLRAAARGEATPPEPWLAELGPGDVEDDPINDWIHERTKDRPWPRRWPMPTPSTTTSSLPCARWTLAT